VTITHLLKPGPFKMEVGVIVPTEVKKFTVIIPVGVPSELDIPMIAKEEVSKEVSKTPATSSFPKKSLVNKV
jgi:hypothetical protein